jgi:hypothetical protein
MWQTRDETQDERDVVEDGPSKAVAKRSRVFLANHITSDTFRGDSEWCLALLLTFQASARDIERFGREQTVLPPPT